MLRFKSQPCGRRSARLIRAATMFGSHGEMLALSLQAVQAGAYRPLRQARVADQRGRRRERACAVRPGVVGQAD